MFEKCSAEQTVPLMSNSDAARLEEMPAMAAFNEVVENFNAEQIMTLMSNNVARERIVDMIRQAGACE